MSLRVPSKLRKAGVRFLEKADRFLSSIKGRLLTGIVALVPIAFTQFAASAAAKQAYPSVHQFYIDRPGLMLLLGLWPVVVLVGTLAAGAIKDAIRTNTLDSKTLVVLFLQIADTVGRKASHLYARASSRLSKQAVPAIHSSSPEDQMKTLIENIWQVFNREAAACGLSETSPLKVTLARMTLSATFESFFYYLPANEYPQSVETLKGSDTGFSEAASTQQMIVYEDIQAILKNVSQGPRFTSTNADRSDCGSMICYPVKVQPLVGIPAVPFVISVKCDESEIFTSRKKPRYELLLRPFVDRICLEFYNSILESE